MNPDDRLTCQDLIVHPYMDQNKEIFESQTTKRKDRVTSKRLPMHLSHLQQVCTSVFQQIQSHVIDNQSTKISFF